MSPYTHLTLKDCESILLGISTGKTLDWSPVNKIDNLNRDFFVLCHD